MEDAMAQDDVIPRVASLFSKVYDGPNNDKFRHPIRKKCQSSEDEYLYESDNDRNGQSVEALVGEECAETSQKELLLFFARFILAAGECQSESHNRKDNSN